LFGPRQSTRAVIPSIITQALSGEIVQVGSTSPKREFNFAPEVSNIFLNVALSDRGVGEIFNVGNGFDLSIREVINLILNNIGKECTVKESLERIRPKLSEVQKLQSDSSKLLDTFGLKYSLSGLEGFKDALAETIAWYSLPSNLQKFNSQNYGV
jgi:nucleoside-diphosphate-sugar epimerase